MTSIRRHAVAILTGLMATLASASAQTVEDFAYLPFLKDVEVAPGGQKMSALFNYEGGYVLGLFDISEGVKPLYTASEDQELRIGNVEWVRDDRVIFSVRYAGNRFGTDTVETRLFAMNPDGTDIIPLFKPIKTSNTGTRLGASNDIPIQIQDDIVSLLPNDPERILVQYPASPYEADHVLRAVRVDRSGRHDTVKSADRGIYDWIVDTNGEAVIGTGILNSEKRALRMRLDNGDWKSLNDLVNSGRTFTPLGKADMPDTFYVLSNHETATDALYLFNAATEQFVGQVYHNPGSDVLGIEVDKDTGRALGVYFAGEDSYIHWLEDAPLQKHLAALRKALPGKNVQITNLSLDENFAVIYTDERSRPGRYYIYDMTARSLIELPSQYPGLDEAPLGEIISTQYTARDGLTIPAFVTLPPGKTSMADAQNLPFVMLPHGGPNSRDFVGFDYWAQFLASRGYGVMQMNFRGSTGYGAAFKAAGDRQWGQAMQDDIADGARWLIDNGHADPSRIAIAGGSYGGYAALMGPIRDPGLYQCAVSFAGVTDLPDLISTARDYIGGRYYSKYIGRLWSDRAMLRENSPARQADQINVPVLLVHGTEDRVVDVKQGRKMARALKRANKDVKFIEFEAGDHYLSLYDNRLTFLKEMETFLGGCIG